MFIYPQIYSPDAFTVEANAVAQMLKGSGKTSPSFSFWNCFSENEVEYKKKDKVGLWEVK